MTTSAINNLQSVGFDKLTEAYPSKPGGAGMSALQGSIGMQEMIQGELTEMMRELQPHLGQNIDVEA